MSVTTCSRSCCQQGWPVAALDLGDVPQSEGPRKLPNVQGLIKYRYAMESMREMGYLAVGLGRYEVGLSLFSVLGEYALNNNTPAVLTANLRDKEKQPLTNLEAHPLLIRRLAGSPLTLGVTSVVSPSVQKEIKDPGVQFEATIGCSRNCWAISRPPTCVCCSTRGRLRRRRPW